MKALTVNANAMKALSFAGRVQKFRGHNASLDKIQKSLEEYLETKRQAFPRFYFLSNDELLEILSQTKDPKAVQPHLRKCYDNLIKLEFGRGVDIKAMFSSEGERVELGRNLKARGNVEDWLAAVTKNMREAVHRMIKEGLANYYEAGTLRKEWVMEQPGQTVATGSIITWTQDTERVIATGDHAVFQATQTL